MIDTIGYFAFGGFTFIVGLMIGKHIHTKRINEQILYLHHLANKAKENNNKFVQNLTDIYTMSDHDPSEFTEMDEMLMSMWID